MHLVNCHLHCNFSHFISNAVEIKCYLGMIKFCDTEVIMVRIMMTPFLHSVGGFLGLSGFKVKS